MNIKTFDERLKLGNGDYDRLVNSRKLKEWMKNTHILLVQVLLVYKPSPCRAVFKIYKFLYMQCILVVDN